MLATILLAAIATTQPANPLEIAGLDPELSPPVRIEAAGKPIDTAIGHAAPFVGDFDGDGIADLLVGQFGEGKLWIYHNTATAARAHGSAVDFPMKLAAGQLFKDGAETGRVPAN